MVGVDCPANCNDIIADRTKNVNFIMACFVAELLTIANSSEINYIEATTIMLIILRKFQAKI